jgi:NAD(P)H-flavin reductase
MLNLYLSKEAIITEIKKLNADTRHFHIRFAKAKDRDGFSFDFGQFLMLSIIGFGEIPLGFSSSPETHDHFEIGVRRAGTVTRELFKMKIGDRVGIRGPYGQGIKIKEIQDKNIVLVAGGVGLVPLRAIIQYIIWHRKDFGHVSLIYGAKNPFELLFRDELEDFKKSIDVFTTVDEKIGRWKGRVGLVTDICSPKTMTCDNALAIVCGPPVMYKFVVEKLKELGFQDDEIYLLLERKMKCGIGKCQHCVCGTKYVCQDGPVFSWQELKEIKEAI